jgi:hypothetical protein
MHGHDHIMNFLYYHELIATFTENVRDHYLGNETFVIIILVTT